MPVWLSLSRLSNWLTFGVVIIAFILSFGALKDLAAKVGIIYPALYPIMIDAGLVIYNIMALQSSLNGERNRYAWFLIVMTTLVSVLLNLVHAIETLPESLLRILAPTMAAIPPLVIFGAFHLVVLRIEESTRRTNVLNTLSDLETAVAQKQQELDTLIADKTAALDKLQRQIESNRNEQLSDKPSLPDRHNAHLVSVGNAQVGQNGVNKTASDLAAVDKLPKAQANGSGNTIAQRREQVNQMLQAGIDKKEIAAALDVHVRTVKRDIAALEQLSAKKEETA